MQPETGQIVAVVALPIRLSPSAPRVARGPHMASQPAGRPAGQLNLQTTPHFRCELNFKPMQLCSSCAIVNQSAGRPVARVASACAGLTAATLMSTATHWIRLCWWRVSAAAPIDWQFLIDGQPPPQKQQQLLLLRALCVRPLGHDSARTISARELMCDKCARRSALSTGPSKWRTRRCA